MKRLILGMLVFLSTGAFATDNKGMICMKQSGQIYLRLGPADIAYVTVSNVSSSHRVQLKDGRILTLPATDCMLEEYSKGQEPMLQKLMDQSR